jgi:hypothetical protein
VLPRRPFPPPGDPNVPALPPAPVSGDPDMIRRRRRRDHFCLRWRRSRLDDDFLWYGLGLSDLRSLPPTVRKHVTTVGRDPLGRNPSRAGPGRQIPMPSSPAEAVLDGIPVARHPSVGR